MCVPPRKRSMRLGLIFAAICIPFTEGATQWGYLKVWHGKYVEWNTNWIPRRIFLTTWWFLFLMCHVKMPYFLCSYRFLVTSYLCYCIKSNTDKIFNNSKIIIIWSFWWCRLCNWYLIVRYLRKRQQREHFSNNNM